MGTGSALVDRLQHVELRVAAEFVPVALVVLMLLSVLLPLAAPPLAAASVPLIVGAGLLLYKRWRLRLVRWQALTNWSREPLLRNGSLVVQVSSAGHSTTAIDTRERYTVAWERFDARRAVYIIKQRDQRIVVSTLAPNAPEIIRDALEVRNYPC